MNNEGVHGGESLGRGQGIVSVVKFEDHSHLKHDLFHLRHVGYRWRSNKQQSIGQWFSLALWLEGFQGGQLQAHHSIQSMEKDAAAWHLTKHNPGPERTGRLVKVAARACHGVRQKIGDWRPQSKILSKKEGGKRKTNNNNNCKKNTGLMGSEHCLLKIFSFNCSRTYMWGCPRFGGIGRALPNSSQTTASH